VNFYTSNPRLTEDLEFQFLAKDRSRVLSGTERHLKKLGLTVEEVEKGLWYCIHLEKFPYRLHFVFGEGEPFESALRLVREVYLMGNRFRLMPSEFLLWCYLIAEVGFYAPAVVADLLDREHCRLNLESLRVYLREAGDRASEKKLEEHLNRIRNCKSLAEYLRERQKRRSLRPPVWWAVKMGLVEP